MVRPPSVVRLFLFVGAGFLQLEKCKTIGVLYITYLLNIAHHYVKKQADTSYSMCVCGVFTYIYIYLYRL